MGEDEAKVEGIKQEPVQAAPAPTPEQQLANAFNTSLNLIVREMNILFANVQSVVNGMKK